jgi:hypothetical protein
VGHQGHVLGDAQLLQACFEIADGTLDLPGARHDVALAEPGAVVGDDGGAGGLVQLRDELLPVGGVLTAAGVQDDGGAGSLGDVEREAVTAVVDHVQRRLLRLDGQGGLRFGSRLGACAGSEGACRQAHEDEGHQGSDR